MCQTHDSPAAYLIDVGDKVEDVGEKVEDVGEKVEGVGGKVEGVDKKVQVVIEGARSLSSQLQVSSRHGRQRALFVV